MQKPWVLRKLKTQHTVFAWVLTGEIQKHMQMWLSVLKTRVNNTKCEQSKWVQVTSALFCIATSMGFKALLARPACICMGFKGYHLKTRVYSMQVMPPMLKTRVNTKTHMQSIPSGLLDRPLRNPSNHPSWDIYLALFISTMLYGILRCRLRSVSVYCSLASQLIVDALEKTRIYLEAFLLNHHSPFIPGPPNSSDISRSCRHKPSRSKR